MVDLTSDIALPEQSRLFVFARAINGPPMPLAVVRTEPKIGRSIYRLDDSLAMMPSLTLSQFPEVELVARWSRSGQIVDDGSHTETVLSGVAVGQDCNASTSASILSEGIDQTIGIEALGAEA